MRNYSSNVYFSGRQRPPVRVRRPYAVCYCDTTTTTITTAAAAAETKRRRVVPRKPRPTMTQIEKRRRRTERQPVTVVRRVDRCRGTGVEAPSSTPLDDRCVVRVPFSRTYNARRRALCRRVVLVPPVIGVVITTVTKKTRIIAALTMTTNDRCDAS